MEATYDVLNIGSGFAGSVVALRLVETMQWELARHFAWRRWESFLVPTSLQRQLGIFKENWQRIHISAELDRTETDVFNVADA